ncbi:PEBP-like protein [Auricularia subglabra TFB-10046 SS5]|nr:PEBP-like protein [Auricularia subglabra TFB-10046 SS5]
MISPLVSLLLGASLVKAQAQGDTDVDTVTKAFTDAKVVPDVVPAFQPAFPLLVKFGDVAVTAGVQLSIAQTAQEPSFALVSGNSAIQGRPYLIAMVDPDAPTPTNTSISQVRHFLGADFVSNAPVAGTWPMANESAPLSDYMGPMPPAGSPAHRYVAAPIPSHPISLPRPIAARTLAHTRSFSSSSRCSLCASATSSSATCRPQRATSQARPPRRASTPQTSSTSTSRSSWARSRRASCSSSRARSSASRRTMGPSAALAAGVHPAARRRRGLLWGDSAGTAFGRASRRCWRRS